MLDKIVFFDLETTGTDINSDRIVSICCVKFSNGERIEKSMLIKPPFKIPAGATEVHGITDEMVANAPTFSQIAKGLNEFMSGCDIGGYNSNKFDVPLLMTEFGRCNINFPEDGINYVDVMQIERHVNSNKLGDVYKRYTGKDLEGAHDATVDVNATIEVLKCQIEKFSLPTDAKELDKLTQGEIERVDISGNIIKKNGKYLFAFGKNIGKEVVNERSYADWMLCQSFPRDTKMKLSAILNDTI